MKKKIILVAIVISTICLLAGVTTFALFTSSANTAANIFTSGTVHIGSYRDGFDTIPGPMFYTTAEEGATTTDPSYPGLKPTGPWIPGMTVVRSIIVYNDGSLDAVLNQVKAEAVSDPANIASEMSVGIYKLMPQNDIDGHPYFPAPDDDTIAEELLNQTSTELKQIITEDGQYWQVSGMQQKLIEEKVDVNADLLWSGELSQLCSGFQLFNPSLNLKVKPGEPKRGCLLAFVVHLAENAGNEYQGAESKFNFILQASQE